MERDAQERKFEYIGEEPMKCPDCTDLSKGMKGRYEDYSERADGQMDHHYMFDNGFQLDLTFIESRPDLIKEL